MGVTRVEDESTFVARFYPEYRAGGFTRSNGTVAFFLRVNALLRPEMSVLDYGAGRAEWFTGQTADLPGQLRLMKGKVARVVGVDIDDAVRGNRTLDESFVVEPYGALPLEASSVDLVVADHVFEHVADPAFVAAEIDRVLRPGGWVCARTTNRWGYIAVGARLVPERFHQALLGTVQRDRHEADVFPTVYRMNTRRQLKEVFPPSRYEHAVYAYNPEPAYFGRSRTMWSIMIATNRLLPEALGATFHVFLHKK